MYFKGYKSRVGYRYLMMESGTNRCLVNLGCVSQREPMPDDVATHQRPSTRTKA